MATVSTFVRLIASFRPALPRPTAENMAVLLRGAVLAGKARTVTACLKAAWLWVTKSWQAYANLIRRAKLDTLLLGRILFSMALSGGPQRRFILVGDGAYANHALTKGSALGILLEKPNVTFSDMHAAAKTNILGEIIYERPENTGHEHLIWPPEVLSHLASAQRKRRAS